MATIWEKAIKFSGLTSHTAFKFILYIYSFLLFYRVGATEKDMYGYNYIELQHLNQNFNQNI